MANGSDRALLSAIAETPIETYVDALFALAVRKRASDIHLEPQNDGLCVRLRVDGLLHRIASPPSAVADKLCARIKVMAAMNIAERRLPLFGRWSRYTNTAALCHTLATTLTAGIPLTHAIPYAAQTCRNEVFRHATQQLTGQVESGDRLWAAMSEAACFPPAMVRLVRLGEETGRLEALLTQAGLQCEDGLAQLQSNLLPMIEPALMLLMGCVVGGIILAMYLPIFSMGDLFLP